MVFIEIYSSWKKVFCRPSHHYKMTMKIRRSNQKPNTNLLVGVFPTKVSLPPPVENEYTKCYVYKDNRTMSGFLPVRIRWTVQVFQEQYKEIAHSLDLCTPLEGEKGNEEQIVSHANEHIILQALQDILQDKSGMKSPFLARGLWMECTGLNESKWNGLDGSALE